MRWLTTVNRSTMTASVLEKMRLNDDGFPEPPVSSKRWVRTR